MFSAYQPAMKRVRKKESAVILASQNLEDFNVEHVRELTKPLFSIPTHQFLFNAGSIDARFYMEPVSAQRQESPAPARERPARQPRRSRQAASEAASVPEAPPEPEGPDEQEGQGMKAPLKELVNQIVDELTKDERVAAAYAKWQELRNEVLRTYKDKLPEPLPLSQQKEFKQIKNMACISRRMCWKIRCSPCRPEKTG